MGLENLFGELALDQTLRDRLPAVLGPDGGLQVHVNNQAAAAAGGADATEITASTRDGAGNLLTYTERRSDGKTRNWTITRNGDGTLNTATVTAWA